MHRFLNFAFCCFILILSATLAGCQHGQRSFATGKVERSVDLAADASLVITDVNADFEIVAEPEREDVFIHGTLIAGGKSQEQADQRLEESRLLVERDTYGGVHITTEFPKPRTGYDAAKIVVHVPAVSQIKVTVVNGKIKVNETESDLTLKTTNGHIVVLNAHGPAKVETVNGAIEFHMHTGSVDARTTNGKVQLKGHDGPARLASVNGSIYVQLEDEQRGPLNLKTTNGCIGAVVGQGFAGELVIRTSNGAIKVRDAAGIVKEREQSRRKAEITFGRDGKQSVIRTTNGSVSFETRD